MILNMNHNYHTCYVLILDQKSEATFNIRLYDAIVYFEKWNDCICTILVVVWLDWNGFTIWTDEVCIIIFILF